MAGITLRKIAAELNLSLAAVSAALGTQSTTKVSEATAARVREYADKVNYRPSLAGKALRSKRLHQIGMLVESDFGKRRHPPVIAMPAIFGLNDYLRERHWQLSIIDDNAQRNISEMLPRYLRESFLDGVVVCSTSEESNRILKADFDRFSIPAVFLNAAAEYNSVVIDDRLGAELATRHLVELGHRNVLHVTAASNHYSVNERLRGYKTILEGKGLKAPVHLLEECHDGGEEIYEHRVAVNHRAADLFVEEIYAKQRPTGIVCYDDRIAMLLMRALLKAGYSIPGDVSIIGFNDMPFMDSLPIALTTVRADFYALGQNAGQLLLNLIENRKSRLPSPVIKPQLIVRESTRSLRSGKKL